MALLKFQVGTLIGWRMQFHIQQVPTRHTFGGPFLKEKEKYMKKLDANIIITFFMYFTFFMDRGPPKVCRVHTRWMQN